MLFKDMPYNALDKKSNIDILEESGWKRFLPKFVIENTQVREELRGLLM